MIFPLLSLVSTIKQFLKSLGVSLKAIGKAIEITRCDKKGPKIFLRDENFLTPMACVADERDIDTTNKRLCNIVSYIIKIIITNSIIKLQLTVPWPIALLPKNIINCLLKLFWDQSDRRLSLREVMIRDNVDKLVPRLKDWSEFFSKLSYYYKHRRQFYNTN